MPTPGRHILAFILGIQVVVLSPGATAQDERLREDLGSLGRGSDWRLVEEIPLQFDTHHPQGLARVCDYLFLSTVEVIDPPGHLSQPDGKGHLRTTGAGVGWVFKMTLTGEYVDSVRVGSGSVYHPGGIDYDGRSLWVPVAEYRPNSRSIIYRVDPESLTVQEMFRTDDHIGGISCDVTTGDVHGVSWGARRFYTWPAEDTAGSASPSVRPNPSHYIDYQDCQGLGKGISVCTGLSSYAPGRDRERFALGGLEVIDFRSGDVLFQLPVTLWTEDGRVMTQNPSHFERGEACIRAYFVPEDYPSRMFVFEVVP